MVGSPKGEGGIIVKVGLVLSLVALGLAYASAAQAQDKKQNIVVFWGDDIGQSNISAYSHGVMGYKTPNIDRIAREGMMFTDYYAEQSCTGSVILSLS